MHSEIQTALEQLIDERNIRIPYACESGSRAWGFESPDSDWDVRFIYAWPEEDYLGILDRKDNIDLGVKKDLDLAGWDLRKTLRLFGKSNASVFEWLQSPTIYKEASGFRDELWDLAPQFFTPMIGLKHYRGLTSSSIKRAAQKDGSWKLKTLFYVLRPAYAATWVIERGTIPPMEFEPLREMEPAELTPVVEDLLAQKVEASEGATIPPIPALADYAESLIARCNEAGEGMTFEAPDISPLNRFFRQWIS